MSLQQIKRELEGLKQKVNLQNSQVECYLSIAKEDIKREIGRIGERLRNQDDSCLLNEADKEKLFNTILESCNERVKDTYFQRWVKGF